jgi:hypothetical protein
LLEGKEADLARQKEESDKRLLTANKNYDKVKLELETLYSEFGVKEDEINRSLMENNVSRKTLTRQIKQK